MSKWGQQQRAREARFWELRRLGWTNTAACEAVGVDRTQGYRWRKANGDRVPRAPRLMSGRYLSLGERLAIADLHLAGVGVRAIGVAMGRAASTVSRELTRNGSLGRRGGVAYAPYAADKRAVLRGRRPKPCKLELPELALFVARKMELRWSPAQVSDELARVFPGRPEMWMSHETIYQALYVQGRGHLRADLHKQLRTGRAVRRPQGYTAARATNISDPISISERPAEADDRAVPGHWEGDLILGANCRSAIGTLVERATRYVMLVHLPAAHDAVTVKDALIATIATLPQHLRRSLTWDRGVELARHKDIVLATDMAIYFCDPHSPWQRGSNENTNGLLRQYFPKGTDLSVHSAEDLLVVAAELNGRPRKTLGWSKPAEAMQQLLSDPSKPPVATTA